jgi:hypothetical protein
MKSGKNQKTERVRVEKKLASFNFSQHLNLL